MVGVTARPEPQPGDFLVRLVRGVVGWGISAGQAFNGEGWSRHDHAEVYLGGGETSSAYPNRRGIQPLGDAEGAVWSSGRFELTFEQRAGIVAWCREHPAVDYGWLDYGALTLHRLGMNDPGLKRYIASSGSMICSQYVDAAYNHGGDVHLFTDGRWEGYVTPEMLAELIA
jgi:hypothetical protein